MKRQPRISVACCQYLLAVCGSFYGSTATFAQEVAFDQVRPILTKYCSGCHNQDDASGEFSLSTYEQLMAGGETGIALTGHSSKSSRMIGMMRGTIEPKMPPDGEAVPADDEIQLVADWIDAGAIGPTGAAQLNLTLEVPEVVPQVDYRPVTALALSLDEKRLAVGRYRQIDIVDAQSNAILTRLDDLPGKVTALQFMDKGRSLVAATGVSGLYGEAVLLDVETGEIRRRYRGSAGHRDMVYAIAVSDDEQSFVTAGYDRRAILWRLDSEDPVRTFTGHNDAIFDCDFVSDGSLLVTASADATVKVWRTEDGERLDTRGEPLKEQYCVTVSPDDRWLYAAGADSRIRKWNLKVKDEATINPLSIARFAHDTGISFLRLHPSGDRIVSFGDDGLVKVWDTQTLNLQHAFEKVDQSVLAVVVSERSIVIGTADGKTQWLDWPAEKIQSGTVVEESIVEESKVLSTADSATENLEAEQVVESEPNNGVDQAQIFAAPFVVKGVIHSSNQNLSAPDEDFFCFTAAQGQVLKIEVDSKTDVTPSAALAFDSHIAVLDAEGAPVPQVLLRAIRDSYLTFRGRDSEAYDDFRMHRWEEMQLNQFVYFNGEVMRLYHYPRGPDSGFNLFPNFGKRHTYFGTTAITHALGEPCYIVEAHPPGTEFPSVGLPMFVLNYENDDDGERRIGTDSRIIFKAPTAGQYVVRIRDSRGFEAVNFKYRLSVMRLEPGFELLPFSQDEISVMPNSYKKVEVKIARKDNFSGAVSIELSGLPKGFSTPGKITIEEGNLRGFLTVHRGPDAAEISEDNPIHIAVTATAMVGKQEMVSRQKLGPLKLGEPPKLSIELGVQNKHASNVDVGEIPVIKITPGETTSAKITIKRSGYDGPVNFGKEDAALNLPFGVYVDNTGLNGVLIPEGENEREFFLTAEPWVAPCERLIFFEAEEADRPSSNSALLRVVKP